MKYGPKSPKVFDAKARMVRMADMDADAIARDVVRRDAEAREQLKALEPANAWPDFIGRGRDWGMFAYGVACGAAWVCIALALWVLGRTS